MNIENLNSRNRTLLHAATLALAVTLSGCASQQKLVEAAETNEVKSATKMLDAGMNPYIKNEQGVSAIDAALAWADRNSHTKAYQDSITPQWAKDRVEESKVKAEAILEDIESGVMSVAEFEALLAQNSFYIDVEVGSYHRHLLHHFALASLPEYSRALIDAGADVDLPDSDGLTPLFVAVGVADTELVAMLLEAGADVSATDKEGRNALSMVMVVPDKNIESALIAADLILEAGGNIDQTDESGQSLIATAVEKRNIAYRDFLIERGANLNKRGPDGFLPLHAAILNYSFNSIDVLLSAGADVNGKGGETLFTPLNLVSYMAVTDDMALEQEFAIAEILLTAGADVSNRALDGRTPFSRVLEENRFELAQMYLDYGADVNRNSSNDAPEIFSAVFYSNLPKLQFLIKNGADVNVSAVDGVTPMHAAIIQADEVSQEDRLVIARILIEAGTDLNVGNDKSNTPVHLTASWGMEAMTTLLLESGADLSIRNNHGNTPFHLAVHALKKNTTKILVDHGADINMNFSNGLPPLVATISDMDSKDPDEVAAMVRFLIDNGVNPDAYHPLGFTALYPATFSDDYRVFEMIAAASSDLDALMRGEDEDWSGLPMLHLMTKYVNPIHVRLLLKHGADPDVQDINDLTALHRTAYGMDSDISAKVTTISELLINAGANVNAVAKDGFTPLHVAAVNDNAVIAEVLLENGANPELSTSGRTPMDVAKDNTSYGVISTIRRYRK